MGVTHATNQNECYNRAESSPSRTSSSQGDRFLGGLKVTCAQVEQQTFQMASINRARSVFWTGILSQLVPISRRGLLFSVKLTRIRLLSCCYSILLFHELEAIRELGTEVAKCEPAYKSYLPFHQEQVHPQGYHRERTCILDNNTRPAKWPEFGLIRLWINVETMFSRYQAVVVWG